MDKLLEQIRQRAHEIFLDRGADHGRDMDDWLQAEREIAAAMESTPSPDAGKKRGSAAKAAVAGASKGRGRGKKVK